MINIAEPKENKTNNNSTEVVKGITEEIDEKEPPRTTAPTDSRDTINNNDNDNLQNNTNTSKPDKQTNSSNMNSNTIHTNETPTRPNTNTSTNSSSSTNTTQNDEEIDDEIPREETTTNTVDR